MYSDSRLFTFHHWTQESVALLLPDISSTHRYAQAADLIKVISCSRKNSHPSWKKKKKNKSLSPSPCHCVHPTHTHPELGVLASHRTEVVLVVLVVPMSPLSSIYHTACKHRQHLRAFGTASRRVFRAARVRFLTSH